MMTRKTLSPLGGVIALFSLIALPLGSCGRAQITGMDLLFRMKGLPLLKILVLTGILCAVLAIFFTTKWWQLGSGITGLVAVLFGSFLVANDQSAEKELRGGALLAVIGFLLVLVPGLLGTEQNKKKPGAKA
jgi:peptidoglycan/LPS O-acetylase OafA/YrhL